MTNDTFIKVNSSQNVLTASSFQLPLVAVLVAGGVVSGGGGVFSIGGCAAGTTFSFATARQKAKTGIRLKEQILIIIN
jgi:hypothetical protein